MLYPQTAEELAEAMGQSALRLRSVSLQGNGSKRLMGGPEDYADCPISTVEMNRVLEYEPRDLTISVEAGLPWRELASLTRRYGQMIPLDPPFAEDATVGGVVACNCSGPRRRLYGTARDMIIGMRFATMKGDVVQSGGMVVKNVAGLDMAKLMVGSFGTLAAIAVVNFKLAPAPELERSFLLPFSTAEEALAARDRILTGPLQPAAVDLLNPLAAREIGRAPWLLVVRAAGNERAVLRYERELSVFAGGVALEEDEHRALWLRVEEFTPQFLAQNSEAAVVRVSTTLMGLCEVAQSFPGPALARAGTGVCYGYFAGCGSAEAWMKAAAGRGWKAVIEFAPEARKRTLPQWPAPGSDFEWMRRVKALFDPSNRLNRGRLYGRI
jgi:glycolate oxidase FAD binding subunit